MFSGFILDIYFTLHIVFNLMKRCTWQIFTLLNPTLKKIAYAVLNWKGSILYLHSKNLNSSFMPANQKKCLQLHKHHFSLEKIYRRVREMRSWCHIRNMLTWLMLSWWLTHTVCTQQPPCFDSWLQLKAITHRKMLNSHVWAETDLYQHKIKTTKSVLILICSILCLCFYL